MKKFIRTYTNPNAKNMNYKLINREYDSDLVGYIIDCCKSLEMLEYIKFLGYEYITDEALIDTSEYISAKSRDKSKKGRDKRERTRYMHLEESRYAELRLRFKLTCAGEEKTITKKILVPVCDDTLYYKIKGTKYILMYQVVDNSTYTTKSSLILKSMMPVSLQMKKVTKSDILGVEYSAPIYTVYLFKKAINIMLLYLAKMGISKTLDYFSLTPILKFVPAVDDDEGFLYFSISSKLYIKVSEYFFTKYQYTRTMTFMLLEVMSNRVTIDSLYDKDYWIESLGAVRTTIKTSQYEKGLNSLTFFDRMLDNTTKRVLKLHPVHTKDIYSIVRWLVMHFDDLRRKDNMNLDNRRLRCNEYIAALLTRTFGERVNRIISHGNKTTMKEVEDIFKFAGDILISQLHKSGLLRFDDRINDMDFFGKLKITMKGPNSLGQTNSNSIAAKFRGLDPSYVGRIDLNVCGTSDPGTSATLTPFCKVNGLYFDDSRESETFKYEFDKDVFEHIKKQAIGILVSPDYSNSETYYNYSLKTDDINEMLTSDMRKNNLHLIEIPDTDEPDEEVEEEVCDIDESESDDDTEEVDLSDVDLEDTDTIEVEEDN